MHTARCLLLIGLALLCGLAKAASSYTFRSDSFAWESAATALSWDRSCTGYPGDDDKATISFTGGFKFTFAGTAYTSARVLTNGGLQFGTDTGFFRTFTNTTLPAAAAAARSGCAAGPTTNVILAYWTDLDPSRAGSGGVSWEQKGTAPNRYVVVSWNGVYQYNTSTPYTFQIILYENGEFKFQYGNANATGSRATIGVQVSASDYTQYSYNSGYNANGSAIRWFVPNGTPTRRAEYRFDEFSYSGRVGEVVDSTTNSNHGVGVGSATTVAGGYVCRGLSIPADTSSASQAIDTLLDVNSALGDAGAVTFWYAANTAWNNSAAMLLDATTSASRPFFLVRQSDGSLRATLSDGNGVVLSAVTGAQAVTAGSWRHIAVSWRLAAGSGQSSLRIYINGVQVGAASGTTTGSLDNSIGSLFIGDNRSTAIPTNGSNRSANGTLDEMRVYNYEISALELTADMAPTHACPPPLDHVEAVPAATAGSTCAATAVIVRACSDAACNTVMTGYAGTVNLSTSSGRGDWSKGSGPTPLGTLTPGTGNSGNASYTFVATDQGVARLQLTHSLAQAVRLTAVDSITPGTTSTSAAIQFNDNAFVWTEDLAGRIAGSNIVVAGRPHDLQVSLIKKDPATGSCGIATDFSGTRNMKLWRTDSGGPWAAPGIASPALALPASRPASNNLALAFTAGVATLNLTTTDIGKYTLNLDDDSLTYASTTISGGIGDLVVRPFAIVVSGLTLAGTGNPGLGNPADAVFGKAGAPFSATVGAYRWAAAADSGSDGVPDAAATLAQVSAGGLTASFNSSVNLLPLALSQTPVPASGGVLGNLSNGVISGFSGGTVTVNNLAYSEVGSFQLNTTAVVGNFLSSGLALDAVVFNASGAQQSRIGRFIPAGFVASAFAATHRSALACTPASTYSYLGEDIGIAFTLTAQNAAGATTQNYSGSFAKLVASTPANLNLAGISGTTMFKPAQYTVGNGAGTWSAGVANVSFTLNMLRGNAPVGPFDNARFGIAPVDGDNVTMLALNLDTDAPANVADRALLGQIPLRYGRLRLQNGMSAANRRLILPLMAQYWDSGSTTFKINDLDACTRVTSANLSFGNFRKTLTAADAVMNPNTVTVNPAGSSFITLSAPGGNRVGSMDIAIALGTGASPTDQSCLKTASNWTAATPATTGANLAALRGAWCGNAATSDPGARATWGLYRGSDGIVFQRENY
ncbi:MAG: DUF6701 domain-containing protein [Roseateles sp.]|uniref:DUF6701 domain-containing protein n=1 Tax=Roseateles sp. TaxID=1971397 RepID=UPI0040373AC6